MNANAWEVGGWRSSPRIPALFVVRLGYFWGVLLILAAVVRAILAGL